MGESALPVEGPQPKPSRFQFVPVPGEFTRGRWKCRDSMRPYVETLEFDKSGVDKPNPNLITVTHKFARSPPVEVEVPSDTIQVTSVDEKIEFVEGSIEGDKVVVTRKHGVTIIRKDSNASSPEKNGSEAIIPPTPMNTPPASMVEPSIIAATSGDTLAAPPLSHTNASLAVKPKHFQVNAVVDSSISQPTRKFSHDNAALQRTNINQSTFPNIDLSQSNSATVPAKQRVFQVQHVPEAVHSSSTKIEEAQIEPNRTQIVNNDDQPTFQVIQTEACKNISMDSIDLQSREFSAPDVVSRAEDVQTPTGVMITVSTSSERREEAKTADVATGSSLEASGIPIAGPTPTAPHSTPYGTPKDTQRSPTFSAAPEDLILTTAASAPTFHCQSIASACISDTSIMPIDNKIEQAMELVKTHLTYAVREEVDTLKNTIQELDYQMREYQYECSFYRQNISQDMIDQAAAFVRIQMQKHQPPTRRSVSATGTADGTSSQANIANNGHSSPHMRNLQNQIQQMKQTHPPAQKSAPEQHN